MGTLIKFDIVSPRIFGLRPPIAETARGSCCHLGIGTAVMLRSTLNPLHEIFPPYSTYLLCAPALCNCVPSPLLYPLTARTRDQQKFSLYGVCASVEFGARVGPSYGSLRGTLSCTAATARHHHSTLGKHPHLSLYTSHKHNITSFLMRSGSNAKRDRARFS